MTRARSYCFTLNNYTEEDHDFLLQLCPDVAKYIILGRETAGSGTPHLQGYVHWRNGRTLNGLTGYLDGRIHWEIRRGTHAQAITYCKKDGVFEEKGTPPLDSSEKGAKEKSRWRDALSLAKEGDLETLCEEHPDIFFRYYSTVKRIRKDHMKPIPDIEGKLQNEWFWGPTGTGKSYTARLENPGAYPKMRNKWWDGYQCEVVAIIDEVELKDGDWLGHHLKIWTDRYSFIAEIKGGAYQIRPGKLIVTSNYSIEQVFPEPQCQAAIKRRFHTRYFSDSDFNPINQ